MDNPSPPYHLEPVKRGTNSRLWNLYEDPHKNRMGYSLVKEFKLIGMPKSLKEIFDLFRSERHMVLWIAEILQQELNICCTTSQGINRCGDLLFETTMDKLSGSRIRASSDGSHVPCPFPCEILAKYIVQNHGKRCEFQRMKFTPQQCRTLATSGKKTYLYFDGCRFEDGFDDEGHVFMDAYLSLEDPESGPAKLGFCGYIPLDNSNLIACLRKLQGLELLYVDMGSELGQAVMSAELNYLNLTSMELDEESEQSLINNIREGRGPKGISIGADVFSSKETFVDFCAALSCQNGRKDLKTLVVFRIDFDDEPDPIVENALLAAWKGNPQLTTFGLVKTWISLAFWNSLLNEISLRSSLQEVRIYDVNIDGDEPTKKERTEQLSNAILVNANIKQMQCDYVFDKEVWEKRVIPSLQHNEHRERFDAIEKISIGPTRQAILAAAWWKVSHQPSLLYALMRRNLVDFVANSVASSEIRSGEPKVDE